MISIDVIQRSAQMLLPDLDGCYWVISARENTHLGCVARNITEVYGIRNVYYGQKKGNAMTAFPVRVIIFTIAHIVFMTPD